MYNNANNITIYSFDPLNAKFIKWSNTLKQIVGKLPTICLSVFDHFVGLALKGLITFPVFNIYRAPCFWSYS